MTKRLNVQVSNEIDAMISDLAEEAGVSRTDVVRRALALVKAYSEQRKLGRRHIGFTDTPGKLDAEVLNVL